MNAIQICETTLAEPPAGIVTEVAAALHSTASMAMLDFTENCDPCSPSTGSTFDYSHHVTRMMCSIS